VGAAFNGRWRPDDHFVISVLAVVAWLVWAQIGASAIVELRAIRSGRRAGTLPLSAWCRPIAIRIAATLAVVAPFTPRTAGAAPLPRPTPVTVTIRAAGPAGAAVAPSAAEAAPDGAAPVTTYVVRADDTLWDLAQTHLGDPLRWREIYDMNRDRLQPDGRRLEDAGLLRPNWRLMLPVAVPAAAAPIAPAPTPGSADVPVEASRAADAATSLAPPAATAAPLDATSASPTTAAASRPAEPSVAVPAAISDPSLTPDRPGAATVAAIGLPSMTAGVLLGYLGRLRRDRERRRRFRHRFPTSTPPQASAERRVRAMARPDAPAWVDLALRHLAVSLQEEGAPPPPAVLAVRAGELGVEILISPPWPVAPGRFLPVDDGHTWRLDPAVELGDLAHLTNDCPAYLPALVTVGDTDSGAALIDLDEAGSLTVEGDTEQVSSVLTAMTAELATAPWSESCDIVLIGVGEALVNLERVRTVNPGDAVAQLARMAGEPGAGGLADGARADIPAGPTVAIVGAAALDADDLQTLLAAAKPHSGLCVIAAGTNISGRCRLVGCPDDSAVLYPLGLSVTLAESSTTAADLVDLLAATAARGTDRPVPADRPDSPPEGCEEPPITDSVRPDAEQATTEQTGTAGQVDVEQPVETVVDVRLLGPVEITWQHNAPKRQAIELVSYLAVHPRGVTSDQARLALWPATVDDEHFGERAPATFWALTTKARSALGTDRVGKTLILREANSSLRLSPAVACDWLEFERLVQAARCDPDRAATHLRGALALVRGRPFEGWSFPWIEVERIDGAMEATIADAAQELVALALERSDLETARFAVTQGLQAVPSAEALLRCAMRVAAAAGDRAGVERAWVDAQRLAASIDSLGEPEPETAELYESLRRPSTGSA
jgi:DNA-binding SARP family transcriptional activator